MAPLQITDFAILIPVRQQRLSCAPSKWPVAGHRVRLSPNLSQRTGPVARQEDGLATAPNLLLINPVENSCQRGEEI